MTRLVGDPLAFLTAHLGLFRPGIGEAFFFEPTPGFYGSIAQGSVQALTDALVILARHVECPSTPTVQEWKGPKSPLAMTDHDWAAEKGPAGSIRYAGTHAGIIEVASTNKHSHFILGATLAHELAHHYLARMGVRLSDTDENERLTDLATIYLGLGKLTLNGYEPQTWSVRQRDGKVTTYTSKIGYLSQEEIARSFIRVCSLRSLSLDGALSNLSPTAARLLSESRRRALWEPRWERARVAFLRVFPWRVRNRTETAQRQPAAPSPSTPTETGLVVTCGGCGQKLRLPVTQHSLRVTCPTCRRQSLIHGVGQVG
jgi:hypothetical protein